MSAGSELAPGDQPVRVWDLPTRVFHWLLAGLVIFSVVSGHIGGNAIVWHMRSGFAIFTLLAFRLIWGFVGGHWSRFRAFVYAPSTSLRSGAIARSVATRATLPRASPSSDSDGNGLPRGPPSSTCDANGRSGQTAGKIVRASQGN